MLLPAFQNPRGAVFLELHASREEYAPPNNGNCELRQSRPLHRQSFQYMPPVYRCAASVPFADDDDLWIIRDARFEGHHVVTTHQSERYEIYFAPYGPVTHSVPKERVPRKTVNQAMIDKLREDFPWLSEDDIQLLKRSERRRDEAKRCVDGGGAGQSDDESDEGDADELVKPIDVAAASETLAELREKGRCVRQGRWILF